MLELGKETQVVVHGKTWTLGRVEIGVIEKVRDWIKEQEGDPFEGLDEIVKLLPGPDGLALVKEARAIKQQLKCFTLQCPLAQKWIATEIGSAKLMQCLLQVNHPNATIDDGFAVAMELGDKIPKVLADGHGTAQGGPSPNVDSPAPTAAQ